MIRCLLCIIDGTEWANTCLGYAWGQLDLRDTATGLPLDRLPPLLSPLLALVSL